MFSIITIVAITTTYIGFLVRDRDIKYWTAVKEVWRFLGEFVILTILMAIPVVIIFLIFGNITIVDYIFQGIAFIWALVRSVNRDKDRYRRLILRNEYFTYLTKYQYGKMDEMTNTQSRRFIEETSRLT